MYKYYRSGLLISVNHMELDVFVIEVLILKKKSTIERTV